MPKPSVAARRSALAGLLTLNLLAAQVSAAATYVVNSSGDGADSNTADSVCDDGSPVCGAGTDICCTLRAAIAQSNATVGQDSIEFSIPPLDGSTKTIAPGSTLPDITDTAGVVIDGYTQDDAAENTSATATNAVLRVVLDGTSTIAEGLRVLGGNTTIRGLVIHRFTADGIELNTGDDNVIEGNFIGTDATGTVDMGNVQGVMIPNTADDSIGNLIGGTTAAARNLLSGNGDAIQSDPNPNPCPASPIVTVEGNIIGLQRDGSTVLANSNGFATFGTCTQIGGTAAGAGNVISGNGTGVQLFGNDLHVVEGNLIGTDSTGELDRGNSTGVAFLLNANGSTIGGTTAAARNVISGNTTGISFNHSSSGNFIYGNYIGTDDDGLSALGNGTGISSNQVPLNNFGGPASGQGNVISGNTTGIFLGGAGASGNIIQGNLVGIGADGTTPLPNTTGISITVDANNNLVGGTGSGEGNVIASNNGVGIDIAADTGCTGNEIRRNSIRANSGLGIDIGTAGVTANDAGDGDVGGNNHQNFPGLTSASTDEVNVGIEGSLNSTAETTFALEFFASATCDGTGFGEGTLFLGGDDVTTDAGGDVDFSFVYSAVVTAGYFVTATATDPDGNTSEFSACIAAGEQVCGNGTRELLEECDDGNVVPEDCCAADCTLDAAGETCTSDGNDCTDDECDGAGTCVSTNNTASCNDGVFCNGADQCTGGNCTIHAGDPCLGGSDCADTCNEGPNNCHDVAGSACADDGNVCTDEECSGIGTCSHPDNSASCDDGLFCNGADTCSGGTCSVHAGDPCEGGPECNDTCNDVDDACFVAAGTDCTSDGDVCTNDECDGAGACAHPNNTAPCSDGLFCTGTEVCSDGECVASGDPCDGGPECNDSCNETANDCAVAEGTPCTADSNVCTDDECSGLGTCIHPDNSVACDDGSACTGGDTCVDGACVPGPAPDCNDDRLCTVDSCDGELGCQNVGEPRDTASCLVAVKNSLKVALADDPTKNKIGWKWTGGDAFDQAMLGSPDVDTAHALCIYDTTSSVPSLVSEEAIAAGAVWRSKDPNGWSYVDKVGLPDGVLKLGLRAGLAAKTKAKLVAKGSGVSMPAPLSSSEYFDADPKVVVQLLSSAGLCWSSEFMSATTNDGERYRAKAP